MKKMNEWTNEPCCKIALLAPLIELYVGLPALRTFITLLAIQQVCEERKYISDHRQGVSLYLA